MFGFVICETICSVGQFGVADRRSRNGISPMFLGALPEAISGLGDPWRFPLWAEIRSPYAPELAVNSATLPETATHVRYCSRGVLGEHACPLVLWWITGFLKQPITSPRNHPR